MRLSACNKTSKKYPNLWDEDDATADEEAAEAEVAKEGGDERSTPSKDKKDTPTKEDSGSKKRKASTDLESADKRRKVFLSNKRQTLYKS